MSQFARRLSFLIAFTSILVASGCGGKNTTKSDDQNGPNSAAADENTMGDSDSGKASGLQTVHYPYDSFVLDESGKSTLQANGQILKDKPSLKIQIEGHCDQRGGIQYNIALGEKRANSAKKFLEDMGISADRITTVSYGKERPIDPGTTEDAYAKNRRANFVITSR
jgi:peptidoglycan-associated lipoprotein